MINIKIKPLLFYNYAASKDLTTYHYKVLFLLLEHQYSQTEVTQILDVSKQNINKVFRELLSMNLICQSQTIGRNKYYKINPTSNIQVKGQLNLF